ncbi:hypothetical protein ADUPG1_006360, partial [Aduncisulcus paluster]
MVKAADVTVKDFNVVGSGVISVVIEGEVAAVKSAVAAAQDGASHMAEVIGINVIPLDKKLGPSSEPKRARTPSQALHLSKDEENSLKQLIKQGNDNGGSAGRTNGGATSKSRTVEDFAASYNKGSAGGTRPQQRGPVS